MLHLIALAALAQGTLLPDASTAPLAPPRGVSFDDRDGLHHARGQGWKATASPSGFEFTPFLGSDVPTNWPLRFALDGAHLGEMALELRSPRIERQGERLRLDHGSVVARYDLHPEGAMQSFVIQRPTGAVEGELTLTLAYESKLIPREIDGGLRFEGPFGGVHYGRAIALDKDGVKTNVRTERLRGALRLVVPATFVRNAHWPIVVDPWLTPVNFGDVAPARERLDLATDALRGRVLAVVLERFSQSDGDILTYVVDDPDVELVVPAPYVEMSPADAHHPAVAYSPSLDTFMTVYELRGAGGDGRIEARPRRSSTLQLRLPSVVDSFIGAEQRRPDISGDAFNDPSLTFFNVVWQRGGPSLAPVIMGRTIDRDAAPTGAEFQLSEFLFATDTEPVISKVVALGTSFAVVAWKRVPVFGSQSITGRVLSFSGTPLGSEFTLTDPGSGSVGEPAVSSCRVSGSELAVCWERRNLSRTSVEAVLIDVDVSTASVARGPVQNLTRMREPSLPNSWCEPTIGVGDDGFVFWYVEEGAPGLSALRVLELDPMGDQLGITYTTESPLGTWWPGQIGLECTERAPYNLQAGVEDRVIAAWNEPISSGATRPRMVPFQPDPTPFAGVQADICEGDPAGFPRVPFLTIEGTRDTQFAKTLHAIQLPTNEFGFFLASRDLTTGVRPANSSGVLCLGGAIGRYSNAILNSGAQGTFQMTLSPLAIPQPTAFVAAAPGETWYFQAWFRTTISGTPSSNFTGAIGLTFE